jgi:predicted nucleic acid-binding protein
MVVPVTAVLDANVLYPAPLRDLFVRIAETGTLRAKWTDAIHDEWGRNLLKNHPNVSEERVARTRKLMNEAIRDCLVTGYIDLIDSLRLPDPDDRHVLAAAIRSQSEIIVTFNLKDFPVAVLSMYDIRAIHPDDFLDSLLEQSPGPVLIAVKRQRESLRNPTLTATELLGVFEKHGMTQFAARLKEMIDVI